MSYTLAIRPASLSRRAATPRTTATRSTARPKRSPFAIIFAYALSRSVLASQADTYGQMLMETKLWDEMDDLEQRTVAYYIARHSRSEKEMREHLQGIDYNHCFQVVIGTVLTSKGLRTADGRKVTMLISIGGSPFLLE